MADASWPRGSQPDDSWGPSTSVRASTPELSASRPGYSPDWPRHSSTSAYEPVGAHDRTQHGGQQGARGTDAPAASAATAWDRVRSAGPASAEHGLAGWAALLVVVFVTALGIVIDALRGQQLGSGFNIGIITGSVLGILVVRRSGMFPVVVAPPIVYSLGAGISLYLRSGGLHDRGVLIDAATNWLVYGFPAIAGATAAVLIIAGIRMIIRR